MSNGQNVTTTWERDERHEELVQTISRLKLREGKDQPIADDGIVKPLTLITVRVASDGSGRSINQYPVRPDTDGADLADEIWHFCHGHGKHYELSGVDPTYILQFHFNRERTPSGSEFPLQFKYQKTSALGTPILDLRDRKNQEAVICQALIQADVRRQELSYGGFAELGRGWQALLRAQHDYNGQIIADAQALRTENRALIAQQHTVESTRVDLEIRRDEHQMRNGIKKEVMKLALPVINMMGGKAYQALGEGLGVKSEPFDSRMVKLAKKFYENPTARAMILDLFKDDQETLAAFTLCLQEYERKMEEERLAGLNGAAANGVMQAMPTAKLVDITNAQKKRKEAEAAAERAKAAAGEESGNK